jgi:NAD(P)-dependent dehydrogenase (short-subunit alcohol dehydrogenase family)
MMDLGAMLAGKRVLATGASSGLGENFARLAAGCKAKVVIGARRKARLDKLAQELEMLGSPQVTVLEMDVASEQSIDDAFAEIDASGTILDVVVNNAGAFNDALPLTLSASDFDSRMETNVRSVWLVASRASQRWVDAGRGGSVINMASILSERVLLGAML